MNAEVKVHKLVSSYLWNVFASLSVTFPSHCSLPNFFFNGSYFRKIHEHAILWTFFFTFQIVNTFINILIYHPMSYSRFLLTCWILDLKNQSNTTQSPTSTLTFFLIPFITSSWIRFKSREPRSHTCLKILFNPFILLYIGFLNCSWEIRVKQLWKYSSEI